MDIGKSVGYVFEDENWLTKVLVGGVIGLIPIVNLATIGYAVRTLQNVVEGRERPLPAWDDFGDFFVKGLMVFIGVLIYSLPMILLNVGMIPLGWMQDQRGIGEFIALLSVGVACVEMVYGLVVGVWAPAAIANYSVKGDLGAFFRFGEIWGLIANNLGDYVILLIVACVVSIVAGIVGFALCIVGLAFTSFIEYLVYAHLLGQLVRQRQQPAVVPAV
jgi:hypothetical protein